MIALFAVLLSLPLLAMTLLPQWLPDWTGTIILAGTLYLQLAHCVMEIFGAADCSNVDGVFIAWNIGVGVLNVAALVVSVLVELPAWVWIVTALALAFVLLAALTWCVRADDNLHAYCWFAPTHCWLLLYLVCMLLTQFFTPAWLLIVTKVVAWGLLAAACAAAVVMVIMDYDDHEAVAALLTRAAVVLLALPLLAMTLLPLGLPDWTGTIVLSGALFLLLAHIGCEVVGAFSNDDKLSGSFIGWSILLGLLHVAALVASVLWTLPAWVWVAIALALAVATLVWLTSRVNFWDEAVQVYSYLAPMHVWLILYIILTLVTLFFSPAWLLTTVRIVNYVLLAAAVILTIVLLGDDYRNQHNDAAEIVSWLGFPTLLIVGIALLALPTYGVSLAQRFLPDWAGTIALGSALIALIVLIIDHFIVGYVEHSGLIGTIVVLSSLAALALAIFLPVPQMLFLSAAGVLSAVLTVRGFVLRDNIDAYGWALPLTIWLTLFSVSNVIGLLVHAGWYAILLNIVNLWLPAAVIVAYVVMIIRALSDL